VRRELWRRGEPAVIVDRTQREPAPGESSHQLDLLQATRRQMNGLLRRANASVVINVAGLVSGSAAELERANARLPARLVHLLTGEPVRLVHAGSAAEYGETPRGGSVDEEARAHPSTAYGRSKLAGTSAIVEAVSAGALDAVVLRIFNPLGPGMPSTTMPGRAAELIRQALANDSPAVTMGPLDAWRDYIDLRDVVEALLAAAQAPSISHPILNVGTGIAHQSREVVDAMAAAAGWSGHVIEDARFVSDRSSAVSWQQAGVGRTAAALGWRARRTLGEAAVSVLAT